MSKASDALLCDEKVTKAIVAIYRQRGFRDETTLEDAVSVVRMKAWRAAGEHPTDVDGWCRLVRKIANNTAVDEVRAAIAAKNLGPGPTDAADEHSALALHGEREALDAQKAFAEIDALIAEKKLPRDMPMMIEARAAGLSHAEIAAERGVTAAQQRKEYYEGRTRILARFSAIGLTALALTTAYLVWGRAPSGPVAKGDHPAPRPVVEAGPTPAQLEKEREELARTERVAERDKDIAEAKAAAANHEWSKCVGWYQQTLLLDAGPSVENDALYKTCVDNDKLEELRSKAPPK
jgi:DNA-directed RNA polymerase specialized sigma24 family protein